MNADRAKRRRLPTGRQFNCSICRRPVAVTHFKRHVNAHERNGTPTATVNAEWIRFVSLWDSYLAAPTDHASRARERSV